MTPPPTPLRQGEGELIALGLALLALISCGLALHEPGSGVVGSDLRKTVFVTLLAAAACVYLAAVTLITRRRFPPRAVWLVLGVAAALRLIVLFAPPFLSSDMLRYVWDGRVQAAGINPYRYVPADPALAPLRDSAIYPHINRADYAHTIYPPAAQLVFQAVARIHPSVLAMKTAMVAFEALAAWAVLRLLTLARLPPERLLIYAWNPLAVWAFAGNGHVDAIGIGLLALTLLLTARQRRAAAGIALGAAILTKFLPAVTVPALWRQARGWRLPLACAGTIAALYACYAGAGWHVLGFLPGYTHEEGLNTGSGVWLLAGIKHLVRLPDFAGKLYMIAIALGLLALGLWIAFRPRTTQPNITQLCADTALLATAVTVAISPHYPWYFAWLALPCCIVPWRAVIWLSVAPVLMYLDPWHERFFWPCLVYLPAAGLALRDWWRRRDRFPAAALQRST